ncbi:MAG: DUF3307 domain-containing protein [Anaerolineales bacterium]
MFWNLFLAHLLGDYPLQPMWLVRSKSQTWGLVLHGSIHFLTMLLLVGSARSIVWPQLLVLAAFHFVVDVLKYRLSDARPEWVVGPYFVDQGIHLLSIIVVAAWIGSLYQDLGVAIDPALLIFASGYLLATHVWFVTEKTISHGTPGYLSEMEQSLWPRMIARAAYLTVLFFVFVIPSSAAFLALAAALQLPYFRDTYWRRALATDVGVAVAVAAFIIAFV